jgi:hypothetical protein
MLKRVISPRLFREFVAATEYEEKIGNKTGIAQGFNNIGGCCIIKANTIAA